MSDKYKHLQGPRVSIPLIMLAALLLMLPIYLNGLPMGNDQFQHFQFAVTFHDSIQSGDLIPSLSTSTNHGFGDVGVRFYPPLSYIVLAGLRIVVGNWHEAAVLAFGLWFFLGGLGVYLWTRDHFGEAASLAAAFVYMIAPYHVNELYNASLFAEFAAVGLLPFSFLFVGRICRSVGWASVAGLAVSYALLILTHLPTALIGSVGLVIYALISLPAGRRARTLFALASSVIAALLLSAFYLVPMATELPFVNHSTAEFVEQAYDFKRHFIASYFYLSTEQYNEGLQWFGDMLAVTAGCLFVPSIVFYFYMEPARSRRRIAGVLSIFLVGVFLATPLSSAVWKNVDLLQKIQFPYRWLLLINLSGSFLVAAGFGHVASAFSSRLRPLALLAAGLVTVAAAFTVAQVIRPAIYVPAGEVESYVFNLANQPSYKCWWAIWAKDSAFKDKQRAASIDPSSITHWDEHEKRIHLGPGHPSSLRLALFYYPHWKAEANGKAAPSSYDENGALIVQLPDGPVEVRVFFEEPPAVKAAGVVSAVFGLAVLFTMLSLLIRNYVNRYSNRKPV